MAEKTSKGHDLTRGERLQVMLSDEELGALDDFRFANRMPSRAASVRELLRRGLIAEGYEIMPGVKSGAYGVIDGNSAQSGNGEDSGQG